MTQFTDLAGQSTMLCDHCRCDMPPQSPVFSISPGKVATAGYINRDYDKGEMVLCPDCTRIVGTIMTLMGVKRADSLTLVQQAA